MAKRDDFILLIKAIKKALPNITNDQYKGFVRQGMQNYGLSRDEAEEIIKDEGLTVGRNYFEVLGLTIDELKNLSGAQAEKRVQNAYDECYKDVLKRYSLANPRTQQKLDEVVKAKSVLIDEGKLQQYIAENISETPLEKEVKDDTMMRLQGTDIVNGASHNLCLAPFKIVNGEPKQYSHVIIPKMTPIPCEVDKTFRTAEDNQSHILLAVYEGLEQDRLFEEITDPEAFKLGDLQIELPPKLPKGSQIRITFKYNEDQTLEVTAEGPDGRTANATIERPTLD